jgi:hypothetical protein
MPFHRRVSTLTTLFTARRIGAEVLAALVLLSACTSTTVTSNNVQLVITQHTANLTLDAGQTGAQTVLCDTTAGEVLISGGYAAADVSFKSITPNNPPNLLGEDHLILGTYPSDATSAPPSTQGQAEPGWTVRASNPLASPITLPVYADCLKGGGVNTSTTFTATFTGCPSPEGMRGAPTVPSSGCPFEWEVGCPAAAPGLTGGGWLADNWMSSSFPVENLGVNNQRWHLESPPGVNATVYAVCAKKLYSLPLASAVSSAPPAGSSSCYPAGCGYLRTVQQTVACPTGGVLVGGGWEKGFPLAPVGEASTSAMGQPTLLAWTVRDSIVDTTGYYNGNPLDVTTLGVCVTAKAPRNIFITFSNYHHLIRIPADQVIAATDGSGQVPAVQRTVRVVQVASGPLSAPSAIAAVQYYYVPNGCGDPAPVVSAARSALAGQLRGQTSADETIFSGPTYTINLGSLTCAPPAGTRQSSPFTYVQHIDGSASQTSFKPADVRAYQSQQLQNAVGQAGAGYALLSSSICPDGLAVSNASATRATVSCPASGVAHYLWTPDKLKVLATQLAGKTADEAKALLDTTPGVQPGSAIIDGLQGARLPTDASQIQLIVVDR